MARPRVIKHPAGGEIILKNVSADEANRIKSLIAGNSPAALPEPEESKSTNLDKPAISLYKDGDNLWRVVILKFDSSSGDATVDEVRIFKSQMEAIETFARLADRFEFV